MPREFHRFYHSTRQNPTQLAWLSSDVKPARKWHIPANKYLRANWKLVNRKDQVNLKKKLYTPSDSSSQNGSQWSSSEPVLRFIWMGPQFICTRIHSQTWACPADDVLRIVAAPRKGLRWPPHTDHTSSAAGCDLPEVQHVYVTSSPWLV